MAQDPQARAIARAMRHADEMGAGSAKRRELPRKWRGSAVMKEFARGTLYSGSGHKVENPAQARAIAASEGNPPAKEKRWRAAQKKR